VYQVQSNGTVSSTEIKVMDNNDGRFYVAQQGLQPGDKIVVEGVASLREGAPIKPREVNPDSIYQLSMNSEQ
jgi:membrane fusion protein (multidrug efflux system)